ncbi:two-component system response regulator [Nitrosopumilus sp.]|uniref:response regulator n=1 Tax=Nitrosopumilus sp. TaxID=2024843 RepID=UPI00247C728C|nr:response regulator transcription factor [Nitrosopumilus sp.]MCV0409933.1 response regulator transcription factor [Nitrosopumilus sp.]
MKPSVIIIDDYNEVTDTFSEYLSLSSIDVLAIGHNGNDAVELYKVHKPDVVLLDYMMPKFNGFYALRNIHKINPDAKVIFLTASLRPDLPQQLKDAGADAVLTKPINMNNLVGLIKTMQLGGVTQVSN